MTTRPALAGLALPAALAAVVLALAQEPRPGRKVALLVGVVDYDTDSGLTRLKYCENDVTALAAVLKAQGYRDEDVIVLTDTAAAERRKLQYMPTADHIRRELRGLVEDLRPEDMFLVAFSGHGVHLKQLKEKGLHFCAKGTRLDRPETMVSLAEVYDQLETNCKAGVKVLVVDACRNDPTDGRSADGRLASLTLPLVPDPPGGTVAFFSCSTGQRSFESDALRHGIFFHHFIQGLKGGPADDPVARRGEVTVPLLEDYLARAVPLAVKRDRDDRAVRQVPERKGTLRGSVVLARVRVPGDSRRVERKTEPKYIFDPTHGDRHVHFNAKGEPVVAVSTTDESAKRHTLQVVNLSTGTAISEPFVKQGGSSFDGPSFSPDGTRIVACHNNVVNVWDVATARRVASIAHGDHVYNAMFSTDGARILTASFDNTACIWEVSTGQRIAKLQHDGTVFFAQFSPDCSRVATACGDGTATVWHATSGEKLASYTHKGASDNLLSIAVWHVNFSPDGKQIVSSSDKGAAVWDVATGKAVATLEHADRVHYAVFSPDGQQVATAGVCKTVFIWDVASGRKAASTADHAGFPKTVAFSQDGQWIVTASDDFLSSFPFSPNNDAPSAAVWNASTGTKKFTLKRSGSVNNAYFTPDSKRIVMLSGVGGDRGAELWDVATGTRLGSAPVK